MESGALCSLVLTPPVREIERNIHVNLFAIAKGIMYMMESELHGVNLKMLHNNMQRYKTFRMICRKF
jgi:hypothetical protein